jgi:hypothetical protein
MNANTAVIRTLNDQLRRDFTFGLAYMTPGVAALGAEAAERIFRTIALFDDFSHANDPHEEHDFVSLKAEGHTIFSRSIITTSNCRCTRRIPLIHPSHSE